MKQKGGVVPWFPGLIVSAVKNKRKKNKRKAQKGRGLKRYYRR